MKAIYMKGITKRFGNVLANDNIDFIVEKKEIHCLLGENGTGKSTLMNILFGLYKADSGEIFINEKKVEISNPNIAKELGIGMVHQHFMLVNQLSVFENIILGNEDGKFFLDKKKSREKVLKLIENFGFKIDIDEKIKNLSVGMKQRVEILKTLYKGADIIILDEPTAVLTPGEVLELFKILINLKEAGKTIVFITHKLSETMHISDNLTVIRKGRVIYSGETKENTPKSLAAMMVGRDVEEIIKKENENISDVALRFEDVILNEKSHTGTSFFVRKGEILGVAGVDGNGQADIEDLLVGNKLITKGNIYFGDKNINMLSIKERKELGFGYIPSDRHKNAICSNFSLMENFLLGYQNSKEYSKNGFIKYKNVKKNLDKAIESFEIKTSGNLQKIGELSGGNQQKIVLAREISHNPDIILVAQPTRGLDIGAIEYVHKTLLDLRDKGKAILLISAELSEVMNLSDRIIVMYEGEISAAFENGRYKQEEIGLFMAGKKQEELL